MQIIPFKISPFSKEAKSFIVMSLYCKYFHAHATRMRNVRNERYAYDSSSRKHAYIILIPLNPIFI